MIQYPIDEFDNIFKNPPFPIQDFSDALCLERLIDITRDYWRTERDRTMAISVMTEIRRSFDQSKTLREFGKKLYKMGMINHDSIC